MVNIVARILRCRPTGLTQFPVDIDNIDECTARSELGQSSVFWCYALDRTAQHITVKFDELLIKIRNFLEGRADKIA